MKKTVTVCICDNCGAMIGDNNKDRISLCEGMPLFFKLTERIIRVEVVDDVDFCSKFCLGGFFRGVKVTVES